ncbi:MAG TPA: hypothetical protein VFA11_04425 [Acidimicrobiales bacterium]|nr:hypothetical protein [Acidimicrobiales bacterium]
MTVVVATAAVLVIVVAFLALGTVLHRDRTEHDTERSVRSYGMAFSATAQACARSANAEGPERVPERSHVLVLETSARS